jgi:hypothetical protein
MAQSVYEEYGIPHEVGTSMMKLIDYVSIESPKFAAEASYIPPDLSDTIERFDIVWPTNLDKSYIKRRHWDKNMAIREFIQNALDAEDESYGYSNVDRYSQHIDIHQTEEFIDDSITGLDALFSGTIRSIVIRDHGKGISYKAFMMGGEDKLCYLRGAYGEGMKIAALYMSAKGHDVYILSGNDVYKCFYSEMTHTLVISIGKSKYHINGTEVLIHKLCTNIENIDDLVFNPTDPNIEKSATSEFSHHTCAYAMPSSVIEYNDQRKRLYVRDMFVNYLDDIISNAFYSYNLWWIELEPNRKTVVSTQSMAVQISRTLRDADTYFITNLIKQNITHYDEPDHYVLVPQVYEIDQCSFGDISDTPLQYYMKELTSSLGIGAYTSSSDPRDIIEANHEGIIPIVVRPNMESLFCHLPTVTDVIINRASQLSESGDIPLSDLTVYQRSVYNGWNHLAKAVLGILYPQYLDDRIVHLSVIDTKRSFYDVDTQTMKMSLNAIDHNKISTFIHELSHRIDIGMHRTTKDVTENFERALEHTGASILKCMAEKAFGFPEFIDRCKRMCFDASPKTIDEMFVHTRISEPSTNRTCIELYSRPVFIFITIDGEIHPLRLTYSLINPEATSSDAEAHYLSSINEAIWDISECISDIKHDPYIYLCPEDISRILDSIALGFNESEKPLVLFMEHIRKCYRNTKPGAEPPRISIYRYDLKDDLYAIVEGDIQ